MAEDVIEIKEIRKDWYDKGLDIVNVHIYARDVDDLQVDFEENQVTLTFYTRDQNFLKKHGGVRRKTNRFRYSIFPREEIDVPNCKYNVRAPFIELLLKKSIPNKWASLEVQQQPTGKSKKKNQKKERNDSLSPDGKSPKKSQQLLGGKSTPLTSKKTKCNEDSNNKDAETMAEKIPSASSKVSTVDKRNKQKTVGASLVENYTGLTGLENYANNCYMNVVIQLLANIQVLRDYLKSDLYIKDINTNNPLCSGGKVVKAFAEVTKALWSHRKHPFKPSDLKNIMGKRCSLFLGWQQHDAQEFFASLLDNLHEDLNQFHPEKNGDKEKAKSDSESNDNERPDTAWHSHMKRNNSFIVKLFHGQLMSKVTCHACHKVSYSYDPCAQISLPIPSTRQVVQVLFFTRESASPPLLVRLQISTVNARMWHLVNMLQTVMKVPSHLIALFRGVSDVCADLQTPLGAVSKHKFILANEISAKDNVEEFSVPVFQNLLHTKAFVQCENCLKSHEDIGCKLKRCTRCMATAYCSRECQTKHWSSAHSKVCSKDLKMQVGLPFFITARRDVSFAKLEELVKERAKFTVECVEDNAQENETAECSSKSCEVSENQAKCCSNAPNLKCVIKIASKMNTNDDSCTALNEHNFSVEWITKSPCLVLEWQNTTTATTSTTEGEKNAHEIRTKKMPVHELYEPECFNVTSTPDQFSLYDCFKLFMEPERLDESESWKCPKCTSLQSAKKEMSISSPPWLLLLHLKRFTYGDSGQKIHKAINYPVSGMDLSPYIAKETRNKLDHSPIYDLCGVINHRGNMRMGHYTCMVRMLNEADQEDVGWRYFDDDSVTKIKNEKVVSADAYVLMYRVRGAHNAIRLERYSNALTSFGQENSSSVSKQKRADSFSGKFVSSHSERRSVSEHTLGVNYKRSSSIESASNDGGVSGGGIANNRKQSESDVFASPVAARRCTSALSTENKSKEFNIHKNLTSTSMPNVSNVEDGGGGDSEDLTRSNSSSFDELSVGVSTKTESGQRPNGAFASNESLGSFEHLTMNDDVVIVENEASLEHLKYSNDSLLNPSPADATLTDPASDVVSSVDMNENDLD